MEKKIIILLLLFCIVLLGVGFLYMLPQESLTIIEIPSEKIQGGNLMEEEKSYQGPVPEDYNEPYFRETGITKPLEVEE